MKSRSDQIPSMDDRMQYEVPKVVNRPLMREPRPLCRGWGCQDEGANASAHREGEERATR
ncbi:hypothetical protein [Membranihabitans marinus]|uniref:hypothetical protein n=1 Tax=Membranihabitans marinus TaxID=1227546 RepID=UPI001F3321EC|nr:hypothetical protein [Membranihabitans marinus]